MRYALLIPLALMAQLALAQVSLDRPVIFISTDSTLRQVEGLAYPNTGSGALTLGDQQDGAVHLGSVLMAGDTLNVSVSPPLSSYVDGLLLRIAMPQQHTQALYVNVDGIGSRMLLRADQLSLQLGDAEADEILQFQYGNNAFHLIGRPSSGCPAGFLKANDQFCFQVDENPETTWHEAADICFGMGARLCAWDQYYYACERGLTQLNGTFNNWEWIDDTSDHTHTADQAGRWSCKSQRSVGATPNDLGNSRCCYRLR